MSLKKKAIAGLSWNLLGSFSNQGLLFIIGIILARLLTPREFGLIGMITIFIAVAESFINSGFSQALIRKKKCTELDLSTVFYYNLAAGILFFWILFISAPIISRFYQEPKLVNLIRVLGFVLIIDGLTMIQRTKLKRNVNFKRLAKISIISTFFSGAVGITMAFSGFGVWSLVAKTISQRGMNSLLLWLWNKWRPLFAFSKQSFNEMFSFGSKLLLSGLINTIYRNVYYLIIGKYFSAQELGYYTRADQFKNLPSKNTNNTISNVSFPILSKLQDDPIRLKKAYKRIIKSTMFITFILMFGMIAVAEPMVIALIGEKWRPSILYLQLLCFVGMLYPLHSLNLNMLKVKGRSDLHLKLEIIKKILAVPTIIIGIVWGIKIMIVGMIFNSITGYFINSYWSGKLVNYPIKEQLIDILPSYIFAAAYASIVYFIGKILPFDYPTILIIQLLLGAGLVLLIAEITRFESYRYIKEIVIKDLLKK